MRKPKRIIAGLALTGLLLTGCSKDLVADKNGNIVTVTIDGNPIEVNAGDMFDDYLKTPEGLKNYYDAVYEVVVRALFDREEQATERTEIYDVAALSVKDVKEQAKNNAKGGGKYDDELKKILKARNVETLKELEEKLAYEEMQVRLKKQFFDGGEGAWITNAMEELIVGERDDAGNLLLDDNNNPVYEGYLNNKLPYHVRHILVKVGAANNDFVTGKISQDDANNLSSMIIALANQLDTFGLLAFQGAKYGDETSAKQFGDLGIMNFTTNFVNEFKLGVYAYDALYKNDGVMSADDKAAKLKIPAAAKDKLETIGLDEIPYGAALKLAEVRGIEKSDAGKEVNDGNAAFYPRNIIFNKYFNKHNIAIITPNDVNVADEVGTENATFAALPGFKEIPELGGKKALTDEKGNVILVVRAGSSGYEGIHFIVVERSALYETVNGVSLKDYYTIETPKTSAFPKDSEGNDIDAFVNFLELDARGTKERIDKIRDEVKAFDPTINDRIFQKLVTYLDVKFSDEDLKSALDTYLANQYTSSQFKLDQELDQLWSEWIEYLEQQEVTRNERLVPESYIEDFKAGTDYEYGGE